MNQSGDTFTYTDEEWLDFSLGTFGVCPDCPRVIPLRCDGQRVAHVRFTEAGVHYACPGGQHVGDYATRERLLGQEVNFEHLLNAIAAMKPCPFANCYRPSCGGRHERREFELAVLAAADDRVTAVDSAQRGDGRLGDANRALYEAVKALRKAQG